MQRIRPAWFAVSVMLLSPACLAQDWRDDDSIWGFGNIGGPHRAGPRAPDPAPILPGEWIAVPESSGEAALLAFPWILEPGRAAPRAGEDGWTAKLAPPLAAAACAFATVVSDVDEVRMARLTGARWLVVNGSVHGGDPERRGDRGVPVALRKGENRLFVVEATAGWELELWKPSTRCVIGTWDVAWPKVTGNVEDIEYPVFNASEQPIHGLHVHYGHAWVPTAEHPNCVTDWRDGGVLAPLSMLIRGHYWESWEAGCQVSPGRVGNRTPVVVYDYVDDEAARELLCDLDPSYERTRLAPAQREIGRSSLANRPQARILKDAVLVYGTQGAAEETAALLARARLDQQVLWYACGDVPLVLSDSDYLRVGERSDWIAWMTDQKPVVLYGNEEVNGVWREFAAQSEPVEVTSTGVRAARVTSVGAGGAGTLFWASIAGSWKVLPWTARPVLAFASRGVGGARLSLALGMLAARDSFVRVDPDSPTGFSPLPTGK